MKLKLKFCGPNIVSTVMLAAPIKIGCAISLEAEFVKEPSLVDLRRIWEIERTFNELTTARLHVDLIDDEREASHG